MYVRLQRSDIYGLEQKTDKPPIFENPPGRPDRGPKRGHVQGNLDVTLCTRNLCKLLVQETCIKFWCKFLVQEPTNHKKAMANNKTIVNSQQTSRPITSINFGHVSASFLCWIELCCIWCKILVQEKSCTRKHDTQSSFLYKLYKFLVQHSWLCVIGIWVLLSAQLWL